MKSRSCYNCAYGQEHYDRKGLIIGMDCTQEDLRFLPNQHILLFSPCEHWAERDDA